ncbi:Hint domain-containing homing endonuclease [Dactylosporangium sucinum]|uniref:DEAD/DEAH box helicase n=1 Tax=Dactylosporangium sucinum TaxID=1424081 RepID=A0A917THA7_9ACTN|nr:Hint domain-containing homing endonuclease [Dactylosporangium sucinum]GGM23167.1 hypothetical protein GCM10007977_025480 [Dactylosporangium sucinum]
MAATYGSFKYVPAEADGDRRTYWAIAAQPHVMTRLKRVFPQLRQDRTRVAMLADTPQSSRDLQWFMDRWPLAPADAVSLARLEARATGHRNTEDTVLRILEGHQPQYGWREPARPARAYQQQAADLVHATGRLLLVDDLGLGKTFTSLLVLRNPAALPALVVTLTALPAQWLGELEKSLPWLRGHIVTGRTPYDLAARMPDNRDPDVLIMSYSKLAGWGDHLAGRVRCVIFDEMQELRRGDRAQKGIAGAAIADEATFRVGLTATPVYNWGDEIHTIVSILDRDALGTREEFSREWCRGLDPSNGKVKVADPAALGTYLRDTGVMLRRTRADVGRELPEVIRIEQPVDTDHERLRQLSGDAAEMARLVLTAADRQVRFQAAGKLDMRIRHATGVAKAPFVAGFVRLLLESEQRVLLLGWHRECFAPGTEVLMYDGSVKNVEDVREGEQVMGPNSTPRTVLSLTKGAGKLYRIVPNKGQPWVCSENHILTVWNGRRYEKVTAREYAEAPARWQRARTLYRAETVTFDGELPALEPWLMGYWLGDGAASLKDFRVASADAEVEAELRGVAARHGLSLSVWAAPGASGASAAKQLALSSGLQGPKNRHVLLRHYRALGLGSAKRIPPSYLTAPVEDRRQLLAGLIDSDGHVYRGNGVGSASYTTKSAALAADVAFLARSLGIAAYIAEKQVTTGYATGTYYSVSISGDLTALPMRVRRKRAAARAGQKNVLRTGFRIEPAGEGEYHGFEVDGDNLFLLGDFTVVHNCYDIWINELRDFYPTLYTGTESPAEKQRSVELFKAGTSRVLMMSLRSGAGLDGLQDYCNVVVFGELDWSPGVHAQAIGRLNRDGQTEPVLAYFMVSDDGSDPPMAEVLDLKRQQADPLVDPDADLATPVNTAGVDRIKALATDVLRRHSQPVAASPGPPPTNGWSQLELVATAADPSI